MHLTKRGERVLLALTLIWFPIGYFSHFAWFVQG